MVINSNKYADEVNNMRTLTIAQRFLGAGSILSSFKLAVGVFCILLMCFLGLVIELLNCIKAAAIATVGTKGLPLGNG